MKRGLLSILFLAALANAQTPVIIGPQTVNGNQTVSGTATSGAVSTGAINLSNQQPLQNFVSSRAAWQLFIDSSNGLTYRDFGIANYSNANSVTDDIYLRNNQLNTTLASNAAVGATSISLSATLSLGTGTHILLSNLSGTTTEVCIVTGGSGTATFNLSTCTTIGTSATPTGLIYAHSSGEAVAVMDDAGHPVTVGIFCTPPSSAVAVSICGPAGVPANAILDLSSPVSFTGQYLALSDSAGHNLFNITAGFSSSPNNSNFVFSQIVNNVNTPVFQTTTSNTPVTGIGAWDSSQWFNWAVSLAVFNSIGVGASGGRISIAGGGGGATIYTDSSSHPEFFGAGGAMWEIDSTGAFFPNGGSSIGKSGADVSNVWATAYTVGSTAGVTCSGSPTASFASSNGIVTHC